MLKSHAESGMTLLEIMLAMVLGLGILQVLITAEWIAHKNNKQQQVYQVIEENAQLALEILSRDLSFINSDGCAFLSEVFPVYSTVADMDTTTEKIHGSDHAITLRSARLTGYLVTTMTTTLQLFASSVAHYKVGDVLFLSDCRSADIFEIAAVTFSTDGVQRLIAKKPLSRLYNKFSELKNLNYSTYYVANTHRHNQFGQAVLALYRREHQHAVELVEGIAGLTLLYDEKKSNAIQIVSADSVSNWSQIIGISLQLDMQTDNFKANPKKWYRSVAV